MTAPVGFPDWTSVRRTRYGGPNRPSETEGGNVTLRSNNGIARLSPNVSPLNPIRRIDLNFARCIASGGFCCLGVAGIAQTTAE